MRSQTDEVLYAAVQRGDHPALAVLVERYHAALQRFLYRMTGDAAAAEDLVQEAFVRMITFRGKTPTRFKPWAYTIAANLARDSFRSAAYQREVMDPFDGSSELEQRTEDQSLHIDNHQQITRVLQCISPEQRVVILLRYYDELSLEEIAMVCGVPLGTVKSRLYGGLRHLKALLEREEVGGAYERAT
jgi:RNA polymerase sigma-70 factor (ECF subfamily)